MHRLALAALLLALVAGCGVGGSATIDAPVSVYVSLPLTGPRGTEGRDAADGARLALERAGGRAGSLEVRARFLDDARGKLWDPVAVGADARRAVQDSSAAAYIGELDSEPTRASLPITNDAGLAQVSPGAGGVDLTAPAAGYAEAPDRYRPSGSVNFARTVPADDVVAEAAAAWASELGIKAVSVRSDGTAFGNLSAAEFTDAAEGDGIGVTRQPAPGATRPLYDAAAATLEMPGGERLALAAQLDPSRLPDPGFASRFQRRFRRAPGPYAAYGYEAMGVVLQAIRAAGTDASSFRDDVRGSLSGMHRDRTVLGSYSITADGDSTECMIQRYRVDGTRTPLGAPCPPR